MLVERLFVSPARGAPQIACERITLQGGKGVVGDRNFGVGFHPGQNLTFVEAEEIERFCNLHGRTTDLSLTRRNVVTRGVRLNGLLNVEFTIGAVRVRGVELCEPCTILGDAMRSAAIDSAAVIRHWVGRGGLRVDVLTDGDVVRGDRVQTAV